MLYVCFQLPMWVQTLVSAISRDVEMNVVFWNAAHIFHACDRFNFHGCDKFNSDSCISVTFRRAHRGGRTACRPSIEPWAAGRM
jgi:hypothetical protein